MHRYEKKEGVQMGLLGLSPILTPSLVMYWNDAYSRTSPVRYDSGAP